MCTYYLTEGLIKPGEMAALIKNEELSEREGLHENTADVDYTQGMRAIMNMLKENTARESFNDALTRRSRVSRQFVFSKRDLTACLPYKYKYIYIP